jgi:hypothetical protein
MRLETISKPSIGLKAKAERTVQPQSEAVLDHDGFFGLSNQGFGLSIGPVRKEKISFQIREQANTKSILKPTELKYADKLPIQCIKSRCAGLSCRAASSC